MESIAKFNICLAVILIENWCEDIYSDSSTGTYISVKQISENLNQYIITNTYLELFFTRNQAQSHKNKEFVLNLITIKNGIQ